MSPKSQFLKHLYLYRSLIRKLENICVFMHLCLLCLHNHFIGFSNSHDSGCQVFVLCLIRPKKYCKFCGFFLRLLASTWHLWSSYRIKPWKAGKLPSVSSLLEISTHLLNLSAFIYFPESSGSCWLLIAPSFSVVICRGGWSVRSSQFHTGDVISPLEIAFWTDSATSRAEMYVSDVYISKCLLAVLKIQIIGDSLDTLCGPGL